MSDKVKYALCGALAGIVCGFLGAGGGIVLVPLLLSWVKLPDKKAFATSVFIILPICCVSMAALALTGNVDLLYALPYMLGGAVGGFISGKLFHRLPVVWLRRIFGAVLIIGGVRSLIL